MIDRRRALAKAPARMDESEHRSSDINWEASEVTLPMRCEALRQNPLTVWLTGLSGSGKSTLARTVEHKLIDIGRVCYRLDGDNVRHRLNRDLGFSATDRTENIRRAAEVAALMNDAGLVVITAFISPFREDREMARRAVGPDRFLEVHLDATLEVCERRDPKGLYAKARRGEIPLFTGINDPYERPQHPDLVLDTGSQSVETCAERLLAVISARTAWTAPQAREPDSQER
jgi:adenylyl-sulfate kinase